MKINYKNLIVYLITIILFIIPVYAGLDSYTTTEYGFNGDTLDTLLLHNGTNNGVDFVTGVVLQAGDFVAGNSDTVSTSWDLDIYNHNISWAFWIKTKTADSGTGNCGTIIGRINGGYYWNINIHTGYILYLERDNSNTYSLETTKTVNDGEWHFISIVRESGSSVKIYIDSEINKTGADANRNSDTTTFVSIGQGYCAGNYFNGTLDQLTIFKDYSLTQSDIDLLYNSGNGLSYPYIIESSNMDLLFYNISNIEKSSFNIDEEIYTYINWTDENDQVMNESRGNCSLTFYNSWLSLYDDDTNFELCSVGCDYESRNINFNISSNTSFNNDYVRFHACSPLLNNGPLNVEFSCGNYSTIYNISGSVIPDCSINPDGIEFEYNTSLCSIFNDFNVTLTFDGTFSNRKEIFNFEASRRFNELNTDSTDIIFNSTSGLWYNSLKEIEYYISDIYNISASCDSSNNAYDIQYSELIEIENVPPEIIISGVITDLGTTLLNETINVIEYSSGVWNWFGSVSDVNLDYFNVTWYCSNSSIIQREQIYSNNITELSTPDSAFIDFDCNNFNLSVYAIDNNLNSSFASVLFVLNDTNSPLSVNSGDLTLFNGTDFYITINATDEYLWFFNVSCSDGFNQTNSSLASQNFYFGRQLTNLQTDITCEYEICDGHTLNKITDPVIITDINKNELKINDNILRFSDNVKEFNTEKLTDRVKFQVDFIDPVSLFEIDLNSDWVIAPNSKYTGHYINLKNREWLDFENDQDLTITQYNDRVIIASSIPLTKYSFNSIGSLNCINDNLSISIEEYFYPEIINITPLNNSIVNTSSIKIGFNVSQLTNCFLYYDIGIIETLYNVSGVTYFSNIGLINQSNHLFYINCTSDYYSNSAETGTYYFNVSIITSTAVLWENKGLTEFNSIPQALTYLFITFLWLVFYFGTLIIKGGQGKHIMFLNLLQVMTGFVLGMGLMPLTFIIGFTILFVAIGTFVGLIVRDY